MTSHYHAVVWLDHSEAHVIHFNREDAEMETIHPEHPPRQLHVKSGSRSGTHLRDDPAFYRDVADACTGAGVLLLVGPSTAKNEFVTYLRSHAPEAVGRIAGIETLGKVTDAQLLAEARRFFVGHDRSMPQIP